MTCLLTAGASYAQFLEAVLPVGDTPDHVLWNPVSNKVYCSNNQSASVSIISGETNQVIATVPVADYPVFMEWNSLENKVYCTSGESNQLMVIDGTGDTVLKSLWVPGWPGPMAYNAVMNKLYVSCYDNEQVVVIDAGPDTVMKTVAVRRVGTLLWHPVTNRVFAVGDSLTVIDCATDQVVERLGIGGTVLAYNPVNEFVYLASRYCVYVLSAEGDSVVAQIPGWASDLAEAPFPNKLFVTGTAGVRVIDCRTHVVTDTIPSPATHILADTESGKMYASSLSIGGVHVIDARMDTLIKSIPLGRYPDHLCWNRTNSRVYIADQMDNVVYVIRDTSAGISEAASKTPQGLAVTATIVRDRYDHHGLMPATLVDATGRRVTIIRPGHNDLRALAPGVYAVITPDARCRERVVKVE